jgi:ABC-type Na+ efflux pump permease subunit
VLNALALWGIALFHEAHIGTELREPFQTIFAQFGSIGLLVVALIYAIVPGMGFAALATLLSRFAKTQRAWDKAWGILSTLLMVSVVIDGILGIPLFTTG